ncbi:MAG: glutamate synthase large subunit [Bacteroidetes bacterium]|nr:MAG: glutamate synthase large subunit [Bacteroidota bacterium]
MRMSRSSSSLYDPAFEHDACGVGFVCQMDGTKSHDIIRKGLAILENLEHRGACGCDEATGDGAGILMQLPHRFFQHVCAGLGFTLPEEGAYGVGTLFLPKDEAQAAALRARFEELTRAEGLPLLGWRRVPVRSEHVGPAALLREPSMWQVFVGRTEAQPDLAAFERKLYVLRKVAEHAIEGSDLPGRDQFYIPTLSARTLVYKGMLTTFQVDRYFPDLSDPRMESALAMVHSRFSTNTFPRWRLAQPFRFLCHNGEINTLRGNRNWMNARQELFESDLFGEDMEKLFPILEADVSDSASLDNAVELLYHTGRELPHVIMMLIPEAWEHHREMSDEKKAFYEYHACLMQPWDGPATLPFTDGRYIGAVLDRNGLRPSRYTVTRDGLVVLASETGVLDIDPATVVEKGRLQPGRMFLVDLEEGRLIRDEEIKQRISTRRPYRQWLDENLVELKHLPAPKRVEHVPADQVPTMQRMFGYTVEDLRLLIRPMAQDGKEALGSMGDDTPLAVLSERPRLLYDYFKQLFAQVTNPPLDAIREELVTSLTTHLGREEDLFDETPLHCRQLRLDQPILAEVEMAQMRALDRPGLRAVTLPTLFPVAEGGAGLEAALTRLCEQATAAVQDGASVLILSDRDADAERAPIPALLATGAVQHHLIREGLRTQCGLVVESGEPREVHHFCLLLGYGADAVHPYLAIETVRGLVASGDVEGISASQAVYRYIKAIGKGILKVMSKMGISTLQSYQGAQIFEAVGISQPVIDAYFTGTVSRLGGIGLDVIAEEVRLRHERAYPPVAAGGDGAVVELDIGGRYQWRRGGEYHQLNPLTIARLQQAVRQKEAGAYEEYARLVNEQNRVFGTLRGLLDFVEAPEPVPLDEVEPWTEIVKRFKTGAMSYGSISKETHETLAEAMNRLGGKSNTGEGGEDPERYLRDNPRRSRIKQVASGRFGVTIGYLASADEIQIKMAQGAKPGEGGQLPGHKVYPWIARTRHSTPWVGLISPPPHHDIYSIEDLAQLIHDLKNANPKARISVKLVSEAGVGTVAAGVAKGKADVVLISGYDGGTGASPVTSIAHAGLPWELGLSETHQTLVLNGLRSRITVECDGQLKTGRDVAVAALLGAEEFGFATVPLVAMGCIMMRKCHLNTCPVGIATQDPELRKKFVGQPEHVINYFYFVAQELRQIMARLGFRTVDEMVGRTDRLTPRTDITHWKARYLDLSPLLARPEVPEVFRPFAHPEQDHSLDDKLDHRLIAKVLPELEQGRRVTLDVPITNIDRTMGTMLSGALTQRFGENGLEDDSVVLRCRGSAGQSFAAFGMKGLTFHVEGDANDYFGKGLSGAKLIIQPPPTAAYRPEENIIVGNVAFYGATSGEAYIRGQAGERFCVRNSGVTAVVEGVGDHGCEYMTGGRVVVLGRTGRNFAAGMSGGIAYVIDGTREFRRLRCNTEMVDLEPVVEEADVRELRTLIERHLHYTGSEMAAWVLEHWEQALSEFVKVMPIEYKKALQRLAGSDEQAAVAAPESVAA